MEDVTTYLLYRDATLVYSGADTFTEDSTVAAGTTYAYQLRVKNADESLSIASEPTTYAIPLAPAATAADELQCSGVKGYIRLNGYTNIQTRQWRVTPASPTGISLNVGVCV